MLNAYRYIMQHPVMVAEWITNHLCISLIAIAIGTVLGVTTGIFIAGKGREGKLCVLLGPSGCGKTTAMKMINRLISVTSDRIFIDRMDNTPGASLIALKKHKTDIAMVFGTDASIAKYGWHVYSDDKSFFPPYDLTPYVRKDTLVKHPEIAGILNKLVATFPDGGKPAAPESVEKCRKVWQKLNTEVDIKKMEPGEVAHKYLYQRKLKR